MDPRHLTGAARLIAPPLRDRLSRASHRAGLRLLGVAAGAQSLSPQGAMQTVGSEAIVLSPYWDGGHVLTLWIGHTKAAGAPDPATMWRVATTVGQAVHQFVALDAARYEAGVRRAFTRPLSQAQFDAAFDFNYNSGAIEVANWVKLFNAGDDRGAELSFAANWVAPAGRRAAERQLFFHATYAAIGTTALVPANDRGLLNWHAATTVDIRPYFASSGRRAA